MKKSDKLMNGAFSNQGGIKEISFKKISSNPLDFEIQPVLYGVYRGDYSVQTTYQRLEKYDYILGLRWEYVSDSDKQPTTKKIYHVKVVNNEIYPLPGSEAEFIWDIIEQKYSWITDYFNPCIRSHTRLPIPEEEWLVNIDKQKALDEFEEKFGCILDHFDPRNKKEDLRYKPKKLDFNIDTYIPSFFHNPREYKSAYKEQWYLSKGNGKKDLDNNLRISPIFTSTEEYRSRINTNNKPLSAYIQELLKLFEYGDEEYKYLIKIHRGVHYNERKGIFYGESVDVYYL